MVDTLSERELLACCASRQWAGELAAHQPYHDLETMRAVSDTVLAALPWTEVLAALSAHPRIGEPATGEPAAAEPAASEPATGERREASWSRTEQSAATADPERADELREANIEYEKRFGHVFLICATGRTDVEMLHAARTRVANDDQTERAVVRAELAKIVALRLGKLLDSLGTP